MKPLSVPTSSAAASPARTYPTPASESASTGSGLGYGPSSLGSFAFYDRVSSSWRTSALSLFEESTGFSGTWQTSGSMRNGRCFGRAMSARPTFESESSFWPTATASSGGYNQGGAAGLTGPIRPSLETIARNWPTPTASDGMKGTTDGRTRQGGPSLTMAVRWPTPMARDGDNRRDMSGQASAQRRLDKGKRNLEDAISASMWPTPHAHDAATPKTPAQISA